MYEFTGTIKEIFDEQTWSSGFSKREFVVTSEGERFPQDIKFEVVKDKTEQLGSVSKGDKVKVNFDLRGNEYKGKYYVNLNAWKITPVGGGGGKVGSNAPTGDGPPLDHYDNQADEADIEEPPF